MNMRWIKAIIGILLFWPGTTWAASLTWTANSETDLAGYRVYQCSSSNCTKTSGNASLLATLGLVTSFNIGTPSVTTYYFVTAFNFANNESTGSSVVAYIPPSSAPIIGVSPTSFAFTATQGGSNPAYQTLIITNTGGGTLSWAASDNASWLILSQTSGSGNAAVRVYVIPGTLAAGTYTGAITISATGAASVTVPVKVTITGTSVGPAVGVNPTSLSFTAKQGTNPLSQTLYISNTGGSTLYYTVSDTATWLSASPNSGVQNGTTVVTVTTGSLPIGIYTAELSVWKDTSSTPVRVPVTFTVTP